MTPEAILVVGDVMLDRRIDGEMTRISPEAPSPVLLQKSMNLQPGGAGNVAANLAALGRQVLLFGVIGDDRAGHELTELLQTQYGVTTGLLKQSDATTIIKTRLTCGGQQVMRVDIEQPKLGLSYEQHNLEAVRMLSTAVTAQPGYVKMIVVSDYNKGTLTDTVIAALHDLAYAAQIPLFVDCKPGRAAKYAGATLLKPNLAEALAMCGHCVHPALATAAREEDRAECLALEIHKTYGVQVVVVTRGGSGATIYNGQELFTSSVLRQEVFDVTGAGDTFMAILADACLSGLDLPSAVLRANTGAGLAVSKHGTYIIRGDELEDAVLRRLGPLGKVMSLPQVQKLVERRRRQEQRIVLTNGCFRTLHHGHLSTLRWARRRGDLLVVAINSDNAVKQLKPDKQVVPQEHRAELLAQLPDVDAVLIFDDPDVTATVKAVNPDILVKGDEYRGKVVPGADFVASRGGLVLFAPMVPEASSTIFD